jgi:hypothetical protein
MDEPSESVKVPEVKGWVRRVVEAAGTVGGSGAEWERRLGWWGVEMGRFLRFCRGLPCGTELGAAMAGYGRYLQGMEPRLEEWRLDQAREALRCFRKGIEGWEIRAGGEEGKVVVRFRVKTRTGAEVVGRGKAGLAGSRRCRGTKRRGRWEMEDRRWELGAWTGW